MGGVGTSCRKKDKLCLPWFCLGKKGAVFAPGGCRRGNVPTVGSWIDLFFNTYTLMPILKGPPGSSAG